MITLSNQKKNTFIKKSENKVNKIKTAKNSYIQVSKNRSIFIQCLALNNLNSNSFQNSRFSYSKIKAINTKAHIKKTDKGSNVYYNYTFDKGRLKNLVSWSLKTYGEFKTIQLLENLKKIGFEYATKAGISLGIEDLKIPPKKSLLLYEAEEISKKAMDQYNRAEITGVERFQRLIDTWHRTSEQLKQEVIENFENTDVLNPVYMMAFSGARGNISQVRQLVGMRGLMADPKGQIIDYPIRSNFREGLTLTEYIISSYGARKGIVDTALRTANAGYLTRRLVDVAQHVVISNYDCGTERGIFLNDMKEGTKTIYSLQTRLVGRVLARDIYKLIPKPMDHNLENPLESKMKTKDNADPFLNFTKIKLASRNQEISPDLAFDITKNFHKNSVSDLEGKKVFVRSPLTCETKKLICQLCYGWSLAQGNLVSIGEAVGIIAAQSIGEPGTQLTMRTFHTGGVFSGDISDQIRAQYNGTVHYFEQMAGTLIRTPEGKMAFLTKIDGSLCVYNTGIGIDISKAKVYKIPAYTILYYKNGEHVVEKQVIAQISTIAHQQNMRDDSELTVKSQIQGQFFVKTLQLEEKLIGPKMKKTEVEPSMAPLFMNKVMKSWDWGYAWILSCKLYKTPVFNSSNTLIPNFQLVPKAGDFVDTNSIMSQIKWILPSNGGSFTSFETKKKNLHINNKQWNAFNKKNVARTNQMSLIKTNASSYYKYNQGTALLNFVKKDNQMFNKIHIKKNLLFFDIQKIIYKKTGYFLENPDFFLFLPTNLKGFNQKNYPNVNLTTPQNVKQKIQNLTTLFKPISEQSNFFGIQVFPKNTFLINSSMSGYKTSLENMDIPFNSSKGLLTSEKILLNHYKGFTPVDSLMYFSNQNLSTKQWQIQLNLVTNILKSTFIKFNFNRISNTKMFTHFIGSKKMHKQDSPLIAQNTYNFTAFENKTYFKRTVLQKSSVACAKNYLLFQNPSQTDFNKKSILNKQILISHSLNSNKFDVSGTLKHLLIWNSNKTLQLSNTAKTFTFNSINTIKTNNLIKSKNYNSGKSINTNSVANNDFHFFSTLRNKTKPTIGFNNFSVFKDVNLAESIVNSGQKVENFNLLTIKSQNRYNLKKPNLKNISIFTLLENNYLLVQKISSPFFNSSEKMTKERLTSKYARTGVIQKIKQKCITSFQKGLLESLKVQNPQNVFLNLKYVNTFFTEQTSSVLVSKSLKSSKAFNLIYKNTLHQITANYIQTKDINNLNKWENFILHSKHIQKMYSFKMLMHFKFNEFQLNSTAKLSSKKGLAHFLEVQTPIFDIKFNQIKKHVQIDEKQNSEQGNVQKLLGNSNYEENSQEFLIRVAKTLARKAIDKMLDRKAIYKMRTHFSKHFTKQFAKKTLNTLKFCQSIDKTLNKEIHNVRFIYKTFDKNNGFSFDKKYLLAGFKYLLNKQKKSAVSFDKNIIFSTILNARTLLNSFFTQSLSNLNSPIEFNSKKAAIEEWLEFRVNKKTKEKDSNSNSDNFSQTDSQQPLLPKIKWYINPKPRFLPSEIIKIKPTKNVVSTNIDSTGVSPYLKNSSQLLDKTGTDLAINEKKINTKLKSTYIEFNNVQYFNYNSNFLNSNVCMNKVIFKSSADSKKTKYNNVALNKLLLNQNTKRNHQVIFEKLHFFNTKQLKYRNSIMTIKHNKRRINCSTQNHISNIHNTYSNVPISKYCILLKPQIYNTKVFSKMHMNTNTTNGVFIKKKTKCTVVRPSLKDDLSRIQTHFFNSILNKQASSYSPLAKIPNANIMILPYLNNSSSYLDKTKTVQEKYFEKTNLFNTVGEDQTATLISNPPNSISNKLKTQVKMFENQKDLKQYGLTPVKKKIQIKPIIVKTNQNLTYSKIQSAKNLTISNLNSVNLQNWLNQTLKIQSFSTAHNKTAIQYLYGKALYLNSFVISYNMPALFDYEFKKLDIHINQFANTHLLLGHLHKKYQNDYNIQLSQVFANLLKFTNYSKKAVMTLNPINTNKEKKPAITIYNKNIILGILNQPCFELNLKSKYRNYKYGQSPIEKKNIYKSNTQNEVLKKGQNNNLLFAHNNQMSSLFYDKIASLKWNSDWESISNKSPLGFNLVKNNLKFLKTEFIMNFDNISFALNSLSKTSFLATYSGEIIKQPSYKNNFDLFPQEQNWKTKMQNNPTIMDLLNIGDPATPMSAIQKQTMLNNNHRCLFLTKKDFVCYKLLNSVQKKVMNLDIAHEKYFSNIPLKEIQTNWIQTKQQSNVKENVLQVTDFQKRSPSTVGSFILRGDVAQKQLEFPQPIQNSLVVQEKSNTALLDNRHFSTSVIPAKVYNSAGQIIHFNKRQITVRKAQPILISSKTTFHAYHGDFVLSKEPVITLIYQKLKTGDIIQGIPKVEQFFEARTTKRGRLFRDNLPNLLKGLFIKYYVYSLKFLKQGFTESNFIEMNSTQKVSEYSVLSSKMDYSHVALKWAVKQSFYKIQQIAVDGVLRVYRSQGVTISDKHLEIIVKQMTTKVRVIQGGQTGFFPGEIVDLDFVETINSVLIGDTGKKVQYEPIILGITKASLQVDSFLSSASFQQTARILSQSAIVNKKDFLKGVKENVILGNLIPAGTGYLVSLYS